MADYDPTATFTPAVPLKLCVFLVELPNPTDLYNDLNEGRMLSQSLKLAGIGCQYRTVVDYERLQWALNPTLFKEQWDAGVVPILHITAHGSKFGISCACGHSIAWENLKHLLKPINDAIEGNLILCLSSCEGFEGRFMALSGTNQPNFLFMVSNKGKPSYSDTAVAFASFYHLLQKGYGNNIVGYIKVASANHDFEIVHGDQIVKDNAALMELLKGIFTHVK